MSIPTKIFRLFNKSNSYRYSLQLQECQIHRWVRPTLIELRIRKNKEEFKRVVPKLPDPRNTYFEWNYEAELYAFGKRLKENFDPQLLKQAFTHRSFIIQEEMKQRALGIENPDIKLQDNRQFADEGEAFMKDYIAAYLEAALPKFPLEGIQAVRDHLMKTKFLADVASHLGTKDLILSQDYPVTTETFAITFKALVAALIHSSGAEQGGHFVRDFVITALHELDVNELWKIDNPMDVLKELVKRSGMNEPELRLINESAKNTILACYTVGIYIDRELFCTGFGESKAIAKEMAAREGLKIFFGTRNNMAPIDFQIKGIPKQRKDPLSIEAS